MTKETSEAPNPVLRAITSIHNELVARRDGVLAELQFLSEGAVEAANMCDTIKNKFDTLTELDLKVSVIQKYFKTNSDEGESGQQGS
jgi:hypothetical protein